MYLLDSILPWRRIENQSKDSDQSVQLEVHRMTYKGGWKRHWPSVYIHEPQSRPSFDDDWWIGEPGRYRHIRRVNGRIDEVIWTYETDDAGEYYELKREDEWQDASQSESEWVEATDSEVADTGPYAHLEEEEKKEAKRKEALYDELSRLLDDL